MDFSSILEAFGQIGMTEAVKKTVGALIETHIKPILEKHANEQDRLDYVEECMQEYLEISYQKAVTMNTIVFRGVDKLLFELYIPITLQEQNLGNDKGKSFIMNEDYMKCIQQYNRILVVDTAGMGKSTLVKYLSLQMINDKTFIPIVIELRKLEKNERLLDYILKQFELIDKKIEIEELICMLKNGEFVIFLDGYDEVAGENKGAVLDSIQDFVAKTKNSRFVMTSREENDLSCLGEFHHFSIKPLNMDEAFALIRKYDQNGSLSEKLINRIKKDERLNILKEFLTNPLLVSLLYKTFEYKEEITYKKTKFYSQVYEALFNDHDKTKGGAYVHPKKSNLDQDDFEKILRRIGIFSLQKSRVEFSRQELYSMIEDANKSVPWITFNVADFIYDITHSVPIFQKDGTNYKWTHKSFMEYFAAVYICYDSNKCKEYLEKIISSKQIASYNNVLDFCYDMKPDIAREVILYPLLCKYITFYDETYIDQYYKDFLEDELDIRKALLFEKGFVLYHFSSSAHAKKEFLSESTIQNYFKDDKIGNINSISYISSNDLLCIAQKNYSFIITLLFNKGVDIFSSIKSKYTGKLEALQIKEGKYYLDDNKNNEINSLESFQTINKMLRMCARKNYYLDIDKCRKMKRKIEDEKEKSQEILFDLM